MDSFSPNKCEIGKSAGNIEPFDEENSYKIIKKTNKKVAILKNDLLFKNKIIIDSLGNSHIESTNEEHNCYTEPSEQANKLSESINDEKYCDMSLKSDINLVKEVKLSIENNTFNTIENKKNLIIDMEGKREVLENICEMFLNSLVENKDKIEQDLLHIIEIFITCFEELKTCDHKFSNIIELLKKSLEYNDHTDKCFLRKENHRIKEEIKRLKLELEYFNKKTIRNDSLTKKYIEKISCMEDILNRKDGLIKDLSDKNKSMIEKMEILNNEHEKEIEKLKEIIGKKDKEIEEFKEKEKKLMRIIYLVYKKGKNLNEILYNKDEHCLLNEDKDFTHDNILNNSSFNKDPCQVTFYFTNIPHKDNNIKETKIPVLDFSKIPDYHSPDLTAEECEHMQVNMNDNDFIYQNTYLKTNVVDKSNKREASDNANAIKENIYESNKFPNNKKEKNLNEKRRANTIVKDVNDIPKLNFKSLEKTKDFQQEFLQNFNKFSESWRKEVKHIKSLCSEKENE